MANGKHDEKPTVDELIASKKTAKLSLPMPVLQGKIQVVPEPP
jgi:hypothetical protein